MKKLSFWYFRLLEIVMVICLAAMCVMVFGNVVLRHFFDSGINTSEELSRFMFLWLTFLGATVALRDDGHLAVDMLVSRLRGKALLAIRLLAQVLVLVCASVFLWGLIRQYGLNAANTGLVTGIPMTVAYFAAYLCAATTIVMTLATVAKLLRSDTADVGSQTVSTAE